MLELEVRKCLPRAFLDNRAIEVSVPGVEQFRIAKAIRNVRATELRHFLEITKLATECDVPLVRELRVPVDRNAEPSRVTHKSDSSWDGTEKITHLFSASTISRI